MDSQKDVTSSSQGYQKQVGDFSWKLEDKIGEGAFAVVYKGLHLKTNDTIAVKQMKQSDFKAEDMQQQLENELTVMKSISGPNVVNLFDIQQTVNNIYIFIEYCPDGDLAKYIESNGVKDPRSEHLPWLKYGQYLKEEDAIICLQQFCAGMKTLTDKGYIHRDIKPANVLVKGKQFKVADFGFAKKVNLSGNEKMKEYLGSPLYESPQILQQIKYGAKTDIWSIGLMFYEMLFANTPWACKNVETYVKGMKTQPYINFPYKQNISDQTKDFLRKTLTIDEGQRMGWDEIYKHPILQADYKVTSGDATKIKLDENTQHILATVQNTCKLRQINVIEKFKEFDTSKDGTLDNQEFYNLLKAICPTVTYTESVDVFGQIDKDKSGSIDLNEFKQLFVEYDFNDVNDLSTKVINDLKQIINTYNLKIHQIFDYNDKDKDNQLDFSEFKHMIKKVAPKLKEPELKEVFITFDEDNSGQITLEEFQAKITMNCNNQEGYDEKKEMAKRLLQELKKIIKQKGLDVKKIFANFDKDNSGTLDTQEFIKIMKIINNNVQAEECQIALSLLDKDSSGTVSFDEFSAFIK